MPRKRGAAVKTEEGVADRPPKKAAAVKSEEKRATEALGPGTVKAEPVDDASATTRPAKSRRVVKKEEGETISDSEVFPGFSRPTPEECETLARELVEIHGEKVQPAGSKQPMVDSLIATILSQNTTGSNSKAAFAALKDRFKTWEDVRTGSLEDIEAAIRVAGLAKIRAQRIQNICERLHQTRGEISLEHLRNAPTEEIKRALAFPGCGPKTVACVLLFNLSRPDFAVDTHVFRLAAAAGWVPSDAERSRHNTAAGKSGARAWPAINRETTYLHLNRRVPDRLKYSLHVNLIAHGRTISPAQGPRDASQCPIARRKAGGKTVKQDGGVGAAAAETPEPVALKKEPV